MDFLSVEMRETIGAHLSFEDRVSLARASGPLFGFLMPQEPTVVAASRRTMRVRAGEPGAYLTAILSEEATRATPGRGLLQVALTLGWCNEGEPCTHREVVTQLERGGAIIASSRARYTKSYWRRHNPLSRSFSETLSSLTLSLPFPILRYPLVVRISGYNPVVRRARAGDVVRVLFTTPHGVFVIRHATLRLVFG